MNVRPARCRYHSAMPYEKFPNARHFTDVARAAAVAARRAKSADFPSFGVPELFVVRASSGDMAFTWELRRFGGVVIQKGADSHPTMALAKAAGLHALADLLQDPNLTMSKRLSKSRATVCPTMS